MNVKVGATIVAEAEKATQTARTGVVEEVLQEDPLRVRVRWSDGHVSILNPAAGSIRVIPSPR
jgi:hypothetical protein